MADKQLKPVMVIIPQKKTTTVCPRPLIVNGVTFDLSSSHVIRLPTKRTLKSSRTPSAPSTHAPSQSTPSATPTIVTTKRNSTDTIPSPTNQNAVTMTTASNEKETKGFSHREVERRRKLKISTCIQQLADCLPYKILGKVSHGVVLDSVIKHIEKLKQENVELTSQTPPNDDSELKTSYAKLQLENILLREILQQLKHSRTAGNQLQKEVTSTSRDQSNVSHDHPDTSCDKDTGSHDQQESPTIHVCTTIDAPTTCTHTPSSVHQTWPVTSLLAVTQTTTSVISSCPSTHSKPSSEHIVTITHSHQHSQPSTANIVQPWTTGDQQTILQPTDMETSRPQSQSTRESLDNFRSRDAHSVRDDQYTSQDSHHRNVSRYNRYRPYQLSPERRQHSNVDLSNPPPRLLRDPHTYTHMSRHPTDYSDQSQLPEYRSRDGHVTSYDSYHTNGTVWRPYSEPHRLSGFGLSDILSHSNSESLHLEPTPPPHINNSFLVDSLLDDI